MKERLNHIFGVACRCEELAREAGACEEFCRQMFLLGWLHDIGYRYGDNVSHAGLGSSILEQSGPGNTGGYRFSEEIRLHGYPEDSYERNHDARGYKLPKPFRSAALNILNKADITTGPDGEPVSPQQRLDMVAGKYGKDSIQYLNMYKICKELRILQNDA